MKTVVCLLGFALTALAAELPTLTLLVGNKDENSMVFVDPATNKVLGKVPTGNGPHEIAASTDGKLAFVANYGTGPAPGSTLSVIDVVNQLVLRTVEISPLQRPHGLTFADGKVYFTAEANRMVGRYDPAANKVDWMMGTGQGTTHMVVAGPEGRLFTANIGGNSVSIIERNTVTTVPVGQGPEAIDLSPDGKELWTAHSRDGGVSIIDVAEKKVVRVFPIGTKRSNRLKFTPDGKQVLVSDLDGNEVVVIDAASRKEVKRIPMGRTPEGILMAKDGARAYVAEAGENRIAIVDLKTLEVTGHLTTGNGPDGMAWSDRR
ncbi:MAG TPA: cytochrome D1 domain-containing protein [Candidatus Acidoferrum sp.]|nr:cytochrome D1 domain-containing protein [Candidatus Acidoferrum sp.]